MVFDLIKKLFGKPKPSPHVRTSFSLPHKPVTNQPETATVSNTEPDYSALANSFNDFLLEAKTEEPLNPNPSESFIIDSLEGMLQGDIPESAVPRLPDTAAILLEDLVNPAADANTLIKHIQRDPALTSDILHFANSPLFRADSCDEITNLVHAVVFLGMNNLKSVVNSALMKRLMTVSPIYFKMFGHNLWQHSLDTAYACRSLANHYGKADANNAYCVGLMHDIGKLAIFKLLTYALRQHIDYTPRGEVFSSIVHKYSGHLTSTIADQWGLPHYLIIALREQEQVSDLAEISVYGSILREANMLAEFKMIAAKQKAFGPNLDALFDRYQVPAELYLLVFGKYL